MTNGIASFITDRIPMQNDRISVKNEISTFAPYAIFLI